MMWSGRCHGVLLAVLAVLAVADAPAQNRGDTERRLESVRSELRTIASERRRLEADRGEAAQQLREVEEKIGRSSRALVATETAIRREEKALGELRGQRDEMQRGLAEQKA
ncbi:MAG: peptidase M23, partial [Xanthomonadaceae bacterium]|nr:peptidase M23 [Xanthomonadaceae bacterium]